MVENTLNTFQATLFPRGAIHASFNPDCTEAVSVSGFTSNGTGNSVCGSRVPWDGFEVGIGDVGMVS